MVMTPLLLELLLLATVTKEPPKSVGDGRSTAFPPGWNGLARTPPMGWRSWNAYGNRITQPMMIKSADALVAKTRHVPGHSGNVSLCDLGYCSVGVDEGWEGCGAGVNGTQHDAQGRPTIDEKSFPDTSAMVSQIHGLGLSAGWYLNGCKCGERHGLLQNYEGAVTSLHAFGFDGVKIDGCGRQRNQTLYAQLMRASGKNYTIENCHWGACTASDDSSCPTRTWCPFNWYRSSGDINAGAASWLANLQTTTRFQDPEAPLSQPGCWAYPDMLEVGRVREPIKGTFYTWNRAHFGAWCVVSAPLILGLELTDDKLQPVIDIIGNSEAIAVNQAWAGHPGMLIETVYAPPLPYTPGGASLPSNAPGDFGLFAGASITPGGNRKDNATSGTSSIRSGERGTTSTVTIGTGLRAPGHLIDSVQMSFRYLAGYTPPPGKTAAAATVQIVLIDRASKRVLKTLLSTPPLGDYSWDVFKGFSPPIALHATSVGVPNDEIVDLALQITNNKRNLQIPVDDLAGGFNVNVTWVAAGATDSHKPVEMSPPAAIQMAAKVEMAEMAPPAAPAGEAVGNTKSEDDDMMVEPHLVGAAAGVTGQGQLWAKRMPGGGAAALVINSSPLNLSYSLNTTKLNMSSSIWNGFHVRDLWAHENLDNLYKPLLPLVVPPFDSVFLLITPLVGRA